MKQPAGTYTCVTPNESTRVEPNPNCGTGVLVAVGTCVGVNVAVGTAVLVAVGACVGAGVAVEMAAAETPTPAPPSLTTCVDGEQSSP